MMLINGIVEIDVIPQLYKIVAIHQRLSHREAVNGDQSIINYRISSMLLELLIDLFQERIEDVLEDVDTNRFNLLSMIISSPFLILYR